MTVYLDQHGGVALWVIAVCAVLLVLLVLAIWIRVDVVASEWRVDRERRRAEPTKPDTAP